MEEIEPGISRLTVQLPVRPGHVHCYVVEGDDGRLLIDTGLALPGLDELFRNELDGPVDRIVITHFHPDHVWGGEVAREVTGAPVYQGSLDYEQCERVWGSDDWPEGIADVVPPERRPRRDDRDDARAGPRGAAAHPLRSSTGADGRRRPGRRLGRDRASGPRGRARRARPRRGARRGRPLLPDITPAVGVYPESQPDPLGAYLRSLERTIVLAPRLALPSHGEPIHNPAGRAREILDHHRERLADTLAALSAEPQTGYELSLALFPGAHPPSQRRFAVAETLAHLERLVATGEATRKGDVTPVTYTER